MWGGVLLHGEFHGSEKLPCGLCVLDRKCTCAGLHARTGSRARCAHARMHAHTLTPTRPHAQAPMFWGGDMHVRVTAVVKAGSKTIDLPVDVANIQARRLSISCVFVGLFRAIA